MQINIRTIPHERQRYETVGDYWVRKDGTLEIRVSKMSDWRYEVCVAIHELAEYFFCKRDGVREPDIQSFDEQYERDRMLGKYTSDQEPGNDPHAPYRRQHFVADIIERTAALALGVDWGLYSSEVTSL